MLKHQDIISKLTHRQKADLLTGKDFWSTLDIPELGLPSAYLSDGPHGIRKQAAKSDHLGLNKSIPATCFPTAATMANSWNDSLGEEMGAALGEEAAAQQVNVLLGPGLNIKRNPRCGRNFEYFSEDPYLAGKMAAAYVRGIQSCGISACVKHFAANNQEERRMVIDSIVDERTLREIYLTGFEIAVKEGKAQMVMSSYNKLNGTFANENPHLLCDILRGEWSYDGVVVTDWAGCNDRVEGLKCGNELEMPSCRYGADEVFAALENGSLDEGVVDENLDRLIDWILRTDAAIKASPKEFDVKAHHALAQKCAEDCIVLLKNDNKTLPLKLSDRLCVLGDFAQKPRYQGAGSSVVNPTGLDTFLGVLDEQKVSYVFEKAYDRYGKKKNGLLKKALAAALNAEKIIFFAGLDEITEAEGLDRQDIRLPANQLEVLEKVLQLKKPVVVVLSCGSAVELGPVNNASAILHGYLGGQAGARAMYNVIFGIVNPSGKLSESYPLAYEDCPSVPYFPGRPKTVEYREGLFVGYRYYDTTNIPVNFPFGFGLSYTKFEYSGFSVDNVGVGFTVTNVGSVDGAEIAQFYIGKENSALPRPKKELKGFRKVFLKAGESESIFLPFDDKTFRYYNVSTKRWETEGGLYQIYIGASSADIRLQGSIVRQATTAVAPYAGKNIVCYMHGDVKAVPDEQFANLLGTSIPPNAYSFYKKNRMVIDENCTVNDLRYSKRWVGRLFSGAIRFAIRFLKFFGNRTAANTLVMGVLHQPVRGLAKFGGMSGSQMEGLLLMFNGHFFKGFHRFVHKKKKNTGK